MLYLLKKRIPILESGIFNAFTDCHTHILPGVDDGVGTEEEALEILSYYERLGVERVMLTPHIMEDLPQDVSDLRSRFQRLQSLYTGKIELSLAAEYMLDYSFFSILERGDRGERDDMLPLWGDHLLVEMSYAQPVLNIFECVERIMSKGYFVVLAHPERYLYLSPKEYKRLKEIGVRFQLNITSLLGAYGDRVRDRARWLLDGSYYDFLGSDIHNLRYHSGLLNAGKLRKREIALIRGVVEKGRGMK